MSSISVEIITPTTIKHKGDAQQVIVPGIDGDFEILLGHTPFLTKLRPGILSIKSESSKQFAVHDVFITVERDKVKIVCETIEENNEIEKDRAEISKLRAQKRLKDVNNKSIDMRRAEYALKRAVARIKVIS